jgi:methyltransferase
MLALALAAQALRYWSVFSLGPYWNVRVIVVPGARPVSRGPYRYLRHPNYLAVIMEGFAIPLIHSAWMTAMGFSLLNAFLLKRRIRCEEEALAANSTYGEQFKDLPRLIPSFRGLERR